METLKIERRVTLKTYRKRREVRLRDRVRLATIAKYAALTVAGILLYKVGAARALTERGYAAIGGEAFALFLPALYYLISRAVSDMIEDTKNDTLQN